MYFVDYRLNETVKFLREKKGILLEYFCVWFDTFLQN